MLESCHYQVKVAIVALLKKTDAAAAQAALALADGSVRRALVAKS
jgi:N-acetylmuramic acid 6-phosphate etherase